MDALVGFVPAACRRVHGALSILCQRGAHQHGQRISRQGGGMSVLQWILRKTGIDIQAAKYTYGHDPVLGYTSARKHAERWVNSTCGYCSVGCGMQLGVRKGRVVSVRGNPDHPVNRGKLCPKGLAEHYAIEADGRALYPMLRNGSGLARVSWNDAINTMVARFRAVQQKF